VHEGGTWVSVRIHGPFMPCKFKLYLFSMQANYHLVEGFEEKSLNVWVLFELPNYQEFELPYELSFGWGNQGDLSLSELP
jgi:hypothetical protein